ncbi:WcbI family polysaccharide biosynthesis putative acetyltransferase [Candidatus Pantoea formicae]|uniref:WcbI family polysaccharide biosynthesis putative acetyltransferase n=1 Tax=Candidatus Pantoea formicae TaxID=2608355 RepID=UPI003ED924B8
MNIAIVGNCQLEVLGEMTKKNSALHQGKITSVYNTPIYKLNPKTQLIDFMHQLDGCDHIFMQYHSEKWGPFSTASLSQYFDLTVLPTLESRVSTPQLGYFSDGVPDSMVYADYRFLHLYLQGHNIVQSVQQYHQVSLCPQKQIKMVRDDAQKYKDLFEEGKVYIDYSEIYEHALLNDTECFSTVSHPNNHHLSILLSAILYKVFNLDKKVELNGNDLLKNYIAPQLGSHNNDYYMMRKTGLNLAGKINHCFFDSQNQRALLKELLKSNYYLSLESKYQNL